MTFGQNPTTGTQGALANNQFPLGSVAVPNTANGDLTALEGGPISTDSNGNKTAPASMYVKDGGNVTQGASTDPNTANTVMGRLTKLRDILLGLIGQQTKANSLSVTIASDENALPVSGTVAISGTVPVSGTFYQATQPVSGTVGVSNFPATQPVSGSVSVSNLPSEQSVNLNQVNGTALSTSNPVPTQVQNFPATQPVSGTVTANAGTNLNTSALALESGGNLASANTHLASIDTHTPALGQAAMAASVPVTIASNQTAITVNGSAVTQPVSLQAGGNLAGSMQIVGNDGGSKMKINGDGTVPIVQTDQSTVGTITANGANVQFDLKDAVGSIEFFLAGTFSVGSTIVFEQSADNTNWISIFGRVTGSATSQPISALVGPGPVAVLCNGVNAAHVRARSTAFQAGDSINVTIRSSAGTSALSIDHSLPPGTATIGGVTQSGVWTEANSTGIKSDLDSIVTNTSTNATAANQATGNTSLSTIVTNTGTVAGAVTSSKMATKAASGDYAANAITDLATLLTLSGQATDANTVASFMGRFTKIRDLLASFGLDNTDRQKVSLYGKNAAAADTALKLSSSGDVYSLGDFTEVAGAGVGVVTALNTDFIASMDVSAYKWFSIQLAGTFNLTLTVQISNDNTNWSNQNVYSVSSGGTFSSALSSAGVFHGPVIARYMRIRCTIFTSNTSLSGNAEFYTEAASGAVSSVNQAGTWTVGLSATDVTLIASAAFTTTQTTADQTNTAAKGIRVVLDVTSAGTGSVTLAIQAKDTASGKYVALLTGAAVTTVSTNVYVVYPGLTASANAIASDVLSHTWRVVVTANNSNSCTYSVGASYLL